MSRQLVNFNDFLDSRAFSSSQILIVALCTVVAMLDGFDTQSIAYVAPVIANEWGLKISAFGPIFGAGLFGLMLGALIVGPAADRFGRKKLLIISIVIFGLGALLTPLVRSLDMLLLIRVFTGLGLGGAMPNLIALTSECSPSRLRATVVTVMFCGVPLGATLGGLLSTWMIPNLGWESVFYLGGILPLGLAIILAVWLPESVRFLIATGAAQTTIKKAAARIAPGALSDDETLILTEEKASGSSVIRLFTDGRALITLLVWLAFFMNLLVMYFLVAWLPFLAREAGLTPGMSILGTALLNLGGAIGGVVLGRLIDRAGPFMVLCGAYAIAALAIVVVAAAGTNLPAILFFILLAGAGIIGGQIGMNALTAELYPTAIRSTGVGWALGTGRMGSIVGPVIGGILIASGVGVGSILYLSAIPAAITAAAVFALSRLRQGSVETAIVRVT
jgi:MFS transporter, AAHS family, 4-hydroxybenzoate transporter